MSHGIVRELPMPNEFFLFSDTWLSYLTDLLNLRLVGIVRARDYE